MRMARFRVRTLMMAVALAALLVWAAMMVPRSLDYRRRSAEYGKQGRAWARFADEGDFPRKFCLECAAYFEVLEAKYRRSAWRPWEAVAPDHDAPGVAAYREQQRRAARAAAGR